MIDFIPMDRCHVAAVAELEKKCFSDPWSESSIASELDNPLSFWLVAVENGLVLGYVGSQSVGEDADVMNLAVSPDARRRGIGLSLMSQLIAQLKRRKVKSLCLEVRASNQSAMALYRKLGFSQVGLRPKYYRHPQEDAVILRKEWEL